MATQEKLKTGTLLELAERCERASGSDRALDADICIVALGWSEIPSEEGDWRSLKGPNGRVNVTRNGNNGGFAGDKLPRLTASLDAAMTLVPEGCKEWHCGRNVKTGKGQAYLLDPATMRSPIHVHGETPALALCAAALRARADQASGQ